MRAGGKARRETATHLISHPVRVQILTIANERDISPARYVEEVMGIPSGEPAHRKAVSHIAYHFNELADAGCLKIVDELPRRGSIEHVYRAGVRAHFTDEEWADLPDDEKHRITTITWQGLMARTEAARLAATIDAKDDRWLAWTAASLDERGWAEMTASLAASHAELEQIREDAEARLVETEEEAIPATFALLGYEAPRASFYADVPSFVNTLDKDAD
jgi:hypothetical protein